MPTLESTPATPGTSIFLEQSRVIRASRDRVYHAWTTPEVLKQWFGSTKNYCSSASLDVRVGGSYSIQIAPIVPPDTPSEECGSRTATAEGVYTKVVPNELLQFTWIPTFSPGEESLVTITFTDARGGTQVDIRHERFATEASREAHNSGWANCLEKLDSMSANL
jgi:uncharacterized protein YndB with AHSA1/START domain